MPSPFVHMPGAQEDRGDVCKGEGRTQGERAHRMRDGATCTVIIVPSRACKGHANEVGRNPGRGAAREWMGWVHQSGGVKG